MRILYYILLLFCMKSFSQTLEGLVTDKASHEPLPGAALYFHDLKTGTVANLSGRYKFTRLPAITTFLEVKMVGYKSILRKVNLSSVKNMDFELEVSAIEASEVVITGTSHASEIKKNPIPMVLIDQKYLLQNSATNVIDALVKIPGLNAVTTGPNISKPFIRGLGYNRVLTLFDGVRQDGQQWGDEHGIEIDQFLADRIEVVKGPASLIYGSDALAGVVNIIPANPAPNGVITGQVLTNYQTNNKQLAGSFALAGNENGFIWGLRASHKQAADYQNRYDGRVYGTKYNETDLNAYTGINRSWGFSHFNVSMFDNLQEVPDGTRDSTSRKFTQQITEADTFRPVVPQSTLDNYQIANIHQHVQHFRVYTDNSFFLRNNQKLTVKLGYQQSHRQEFAHPQQPSVPGLNLLLNTFTHDFKYYLPVMKGWETVIGENGMIQTNSNGSATEFVIPDYQSYDAGFFAFTRKTLGRLDFSAGARHDTRFFQSDPMWVASDPQTGFKYQTQANSTSPTLFQQFGSYYHVFNGFSGSLGATFNFNDNFGLKANVSRGYRAPNIAELTASGVHPGTGFEQLGNTNFQPEFNLQEDIGAFFSSRHISGSFELFNNVISNYIFNERLRNKSGTDSIYIQNGFRYPVFKFQQTTAQLYGGEVSIDIHPHPLDWLHIENSISFIYAMNLGGNGIAITDSNKYLPYIPPVHTSSEIRGDFKKKSKYFRSFYVKVGAEVYATQSRALLADNTETKTQGYTLFNAGLGFEVTGKSGKTLCFFNLNVNNLTDVAYQSNMSRLKYFDNYPNNWTGRSGIYSMGRNISFKLVFPIHVNVKKDPAETSQIKP